MKKALLIILGVVVVGAAFILVLWQSKPRAVTLPPQEPSQPSVAGEAPAMPPLPFDIETYKGTRAPFSISYPSIYLMREAPEVSSGFGTVTPAVSFSAPDEERAGTNLVESAVMVGTSAEEAAVAGCTQAQEGEKRLGSIEIDGTPFAIFTREGAAAGNFYQTVRYRAVRSATCYEVTLLIHSGNIGNYPEGSVIEFDRPDTLERLKAILYSFKFGA